MKTDFSREMFMDTTNDIKNSGEQIAESEGSD